MPIVRACREEDLPALTAIYNDVILNTTAIYSEEPVDLADRRRWFVSRRQQGYPVLVAEQGSQVIGFATFGDFRPWPGYRFTVEHSVHVRADHRRQGVGTLLILELLPLAAALGKHMMIAGIDADNVGSIILHERIGFAQAGHFREVGYKFGRRLDLVFLQRQCDVGAPLPKAPRTAVPSETDRTESGRRIG